MKCKYHYCNNEVIKKPQHRKFFCSVNCKSKYQVDKWRWKRKFKCVEYKGGKCEDCGYDKCITALEFHHRDPDKKDFAISAPTTKSWERVKKELDKCSILCANCHREREFEYSVENKPFIKEFTPSKLQ